MPRKSSRRPSTTAVATPVATNDDDTDTATGSELIPAPRITKAALLRAMLSAPGGASLASMMQATDWQAHTVRAALSGLRKSGLALVREKVGADTIYRIVDERTQDAPVLPGQPASPPTALDAAPVETEVRA